MEKRKQIVAIADDFTGAAEIGGIGLRYGLKVAIEPVPVYNADVDLLIVATDTRSKTSREAADQITKITQLVKSFNPYLIFKKIDSVLRGHVTAELEAQLVAMGLERSVIVAANPTFDRVIRDGHYFIDNVELNHSPFSLDHQYPVTSNHVLEILKPSRLFPLVCKKPGEELPERGLIVGDVETSDDLDAWAGIYNRKTLFAGASGFFNALLSYLDIPGEKYIPNATVIGERVLFVWGSAYPKDDKILEKMKGGGHCHINMPAEIFYSGEIRGRVFNHWVDETVDAIEKYRKVIVSSFHKNPKDPALFPGIKNIMAKLVKEVLDRVALDEILIEGGSTTAEVLGELKVKRLMPIQELDTGVIRMEIEHMDGLHLTTKPGSYTWPETVWLEKAKEKYNQKIAISPASNA